LTALLGDERAFDRPILSAAGASPKSARLSRASAVKRGVESFVATSGPKTLISGGVLSARKGPMIFDTVSLPAVAVMRSS
jgi:hypothetical protein